METTNDYACSKSYSSTVKRKSPLCTEWQSIIAGFNTGSAVLVSFDRRHAFEGAKTSKIACTICILTTFIGGNCSNVWLFETLKCIRPSSTMSLDSHLRCLGTRFTCRANTFPTWPQRNLKTEQYQLEHTTLWASFLPVVIKVDAFGSQLCWVHSHRHQSDGVCKNEEHW